MSLREKLEELLKTEKEETNSEESNEGATTNESNNVAHISELELQNKELQKEIAELQKANRALLNNATIPQSKMSFSEIMRNQTYHPLKQRGE